MDIVSGGKEAVNWQRATSNVNFSSIILRTMDINKPALESVNRVSFKLPRQCHLPSTAAPVAVQSRPKPSTAVCQRTITEVSLLNVGWLVGLNSIRD